MGKRRRLPFLFWCILCVINTGWIDIGAALVVHRALLPLCTDGGLLLQRCWAFQWRIGCAHWHQKGKGTSSNLAANCSSLYSAEDLRLKIWYLWRLMRRVLEHQTWETNLSTALCGHISLLLQSPSLDVLVYGWKQGEQGSQSLQQIPLHRTTFWSL